VANIGKRPSRTCTRHYLKELKAAEEERGSKILDHQKTGVFHVSMKNTSRNRRLFVEPTLCESLGRGGSWGTA